LKEHLGEEKFQTDKSSMVSWTGYSVRLYLSMLLASVPYHGDGKDIWVETIPRKGVAVWLFWHV
jgi:hypothetical protein